MALVGILVVLALGFATGGFGAAQRGESQALDQGAISCNIPLNQQSCQSPVQSFDAGFPATAVTRIQLTLISAPPSNTLTTHEYAALPFQSVSGGAPVTWTNMPASTEAAPIEIYGVSTGDTPKGNQLTWTASDPNYNQFTWYLPCFNASNSTNAHLKIQFSNNGGTVWNDVGSSNPGAPINIGSACSPSPALTGGTTLPANFWAFGGPCLNPCQFRIAGVCPATLSCGNPAFGNIYIVFQAVIIITNGVTPPQLHLFPGVGTPTGFFFTETTIVSVNVATPVSFDWTATVCLNGSATC